MGQWHGPSRRHSDEVCKKENTPYNFTRQQEIMYNENIMMGLIS